MKAWTNVKGSPSNDNFCSRDVIVFYILKWIISTIGALLVGFSRESKSIEIFLVSTGRNLYPSTRRSSSTKKLRSWHVKILDFIRQKCNEDRKILFGGVGERSAPVGREQERERERKRALPVRIINFIVPRTLHRYSAVYSDILELNLVPATHFKALSRLLWFTRLYVYCEFRYSRLHRSILWKRICFEHQLNQKSPTRIPYIVTVLSIQFPLYLFACLFTVLWFSLAAASSRASCSRQDNRIAACRSMSLSSRSCSGTLSIPDSVITFESGNWFGQILSSIESYGINDIEIYVRNMELTILKCTNSASFLSSSLLF